MELIRLSNGRSKAIDALSPTYIGMCDGHRGYEHPTRGDESPLLVKVDGRWFLTDQWEPCTVELG